MDFPLIFAFSKAARKVDNASPTGTVNVFQGIAEGSPYFFVTDHFFVVRKTYKSRHIKFVYIIKTEPDILDKRPDIKHQQTQGNGCNQDICGNPVFFLSFRRFF